MVDMTDRNTQEMAVTLKFTYPAEVFPGEEDDMFAVADQEQEFFVKEFERFLDEFNLSSGPEVNITPILLS